MLALLFNETEIKKSLFNNVVKLQTFTSTHSLPIITKTTQTQNMHSQNKRQDLHQSLHSAVPPRTDLCLGTILCTEAGRGKLLQNIKILRKINQICMFIIYKQTYLILKKYASFILPHSLQYDSFVIGYFHFQDG